MKIFTHYIIPSINEFSNYLQNLQDIIFLLNFIFIFFAIFACFKYIIIHKADNNINIQFNKNLDHDYNRANNRNRRNVIDLRFANINRRTTTIDHNNNNIVRCPDHSSVLFYDNNDPTGSTIFGLPPYRSSAYPVSVFVNNILVKGYCVRGPRRSIVGGMFFRVNKRLWDIKATTNDITTLGFPVVRVDNRCRIFSSNPEVTGILDEKGKDRRFNISTITN